MKKSFSKFSLLSLYLILLCSCGKSDYQTSADSYSNDEYSSQNYTDNSTDYDSNSYPQDEERNQARSEVIEAQDELNSAVRRLNYGDWENDLPRVQRKLRDLEDANDHFSSLGGNNNLSYEIDRMKRDMRRLESENWQDVVPDINRRNRDIEFESSNLE